jgi:hypothetical protein
MPLTSARFNVRAFGPFKAYFIIHRHPENPDGLKPVRVFRADFLLATFSPSGFLVIAAFRRKQRENLALFGL